jgi:predicted enzyme related to lactoylglutathione lyase
MPTRDSAPVGAPCWVDLWTSDVEGSRRFYSDLFGWEALEPNADFGGYFMFTRAGRPIAGGMGSMGDMEANNSWTIYFATDDITKSIELAQAAGATIVVPAMAVADLGTQAVLVDTTGASVGLWQPGTFPGFLDLYEHGAPSWFELLTTDQAKAEAFYGSVLPVETRVDSDTNELRYTILHSRSADEDVAGIMDGSAFLSADASGSWSTYWKVDDMTAAAAKVKELGGSVVSEPADTPWGILAEIADPAGAHFKLHTPST